MRALCLTVLLICTAPFCGAETFRIATFNTELSRKGPGLLLRDIQKGTDPQVLAVAAVIVDTRPDILVLQGFDWDHGLKALGALQSLLTSKGLSLQYSYSARPNSGLATHIDLDGNGEQNNLKDAQSYGEFTGARGIALLSKFPLTLPPVLDLTALLWKDLPSADLPLTPEGHAFLSQDALNVQRLSSTNHWAISVHLTKDTSFTLLAFQAGPPVFDGPEDRNGLRNQDELRLIEYMLSGQFGPLPDAPVVVLGGANLDPNQGEGKREAIKRLLTHPQLQDLPNLRDINTVDWPHIGQMRVDYILPGTDLTAYDAGVLWPETADHPAALASRHRLVWADISLPE